MNEELKKKIAAQTRDLQRKAAAINEALEATEKREREENANRKLKEQAQESSTPPPVNVRTLDEVIKDGSVLEKAALLVQDREMKMNFNSGTMTDEDRKRLGASLRNKEERDEFVGYTEIYDKLNKYLNQLSYVFKMFQLDASLLANLLNRWNSYEQQAEMLTLLLDGDEKASNIDRVLSAVTPSTESGEVAFHYNKDKSRIEADITIEGGLYSKIQQEAKGLTEKLSGLKAYVEVIWDYILKNHYLPLMPMRIETIYDNVTGELFLRYIVKDKTFLRSELNYRKIDKKEPVTEEEEFRAVVPDYYEVEADKEVIRNCKKIIKKL